MTLPSRNNHHRACEWQCGQTVNISLPSFSGMLSSVGPERESLIINPGTPHPFTVCSAVFPPLGSHLLFPLLLTSLAHHTFPYTLPWKFSFTLRFYQPKNRQITSPAVNSWLRFRSLLPVESTGISTNLSTPTPNTCPHKFSKLKPRKLHDKQKCGFHISVFLFLPH